ncbi:MAG: hypothetical protein CVT98_07230, partial [Bacteroidetes bacterium HGW-Bacteroidetes-15]
QQAITETEIVSDDSHVNDSIFEEEELEIESTNLNDSSSDIDYNSDYDTIGALSSNVINSAYIIQVKNFVLYSSPNGIIKLNENKKGDILTKGTGPYLNSFGDWLIFGFETLQKIKIDGSDYQVLDSTRVRYIHSYGDWIFYMDDYSHHIKRIRINGSEGSSIVNNVAGFFSLSSNYLFFNLFHSNGIFRVNHDGGQELQISEVNPHRLIAYGNYLYYTDHKDFLLYRVNEQGDDLTVIGKNKISSFNINNYIYYSTIEGVFRMDLEGNNLTKLYDVVVYDLNILNEWIYCYDEDENLLRLRIDGSDYEYIR